jgi:hypothetical protein
MLFDPENRSSKLLERVVRHRETAERSWHRAYTELRKAIEARLNETDGNVEFVATKPPERNRPNELTLTFTSRALCRARQVCRNLQVFSASDFWPARSLADLRGECYDCDTCAS